MPVPVPQKKGDPVLVARDEHPRADTSLEALAKLRPAFREGGTVTAGNSSGINDGAAAPLVVEAERARGWASSRSPASSATAVAGVDPAIMGVGPVPASRKALARAGIDVGDLDLVELNEAFAAQSLACIDELGLDPEKVNVNGGAIAIGHPLGLHRRPPDDRRSCTSSAAAAAASAWSTMCIGVGQGIATVVERIEG